MIYHVDPTLFQKYPGYVRGVVVARRMVNIEPPIDEVARMLKGAHKTVRERSDLEPLAAQPNIAAWREAYRAFGARQAAHRGSSGATGMGKPTSYPSSIEAMLKRVRRGDEIPYINTLAALCNSTSLRYLVPIGGHAIDVLSDEHQLQLGFAAGSEEFTAFGASSIEHPEPGEVIFAAVEQAFQPTSQSQPVPTVLCRRWTWRQAEFTKLVRATTAAEINVDGLPPVTPSDVELICNDLANLASIYTGATVEGKMLSEATPTIDL